MPRPGRKKRDDSLASALRQKLDECGYRCALSDRLLAVENTDLEHIEARCNGGVDDPNNFQWVDRSVNRAKGTMSQEAFIQMCNEVARKHPRSQQHGQQVNVTGQNVTCNFGSVNDVSAMET